jgi:glycosyltransferase 2 family protein
VISSRRRLSSLVGGLIGLVGLGFVLRLVTREWATVVTLAADGSPWWFALALSAGLIGMTGIGLTWGIIVRDIDRPLPLSETLRGYFVGQLGKYVPGGVWAVMGRGEWASKAGVGRGAAYLSTLISMATAYLAAASLVGVALSVGARPVGSSWLAIGIAFLAPVGLMGMHPRILGWGLAMIGRLRSSTGTYLPPAWADSAGYVLRQIPSWALISVATWSVARGLGVDMGVLALVLATCTGWVAGFLFLPTPGGIGVREAAFVAVLGGEGVAAGVALAARLVFVLVDALGAMLASSLVAARRESG